MLRNVLNDFLITIMWISIVNDYFMSKDQIISLENLCATMEHHEVKHMGEEGTIRRRNLHL